MTHQCCGDSPDLIRNTLDIIGDKWTALILRRLHEGPKKFSDFEKQIDGINPRTLSQRLSKLTDCGLIKRQDIGKQSPYLLTQAGEDLDGVIHQMALWGKKHANKPQPGLK